MTRALLPFLALTLAAWSPQEAPAPERVRLEFKPAKGSAYVVAFEERESWDHGDSKGSHDIRWTMRHSIAAVSKKGRVFVEGTFLEASYGCDVTVEGAARKSSFAWSAEGGFREQSGDAVERFAKKELAEGLKLVFDGRGLPEQGGC